MSIYKYYLSNLVNPRHKHAGCFLIGEMQDYKCILSEWILWFWFSVCLSALAVKTLRVYLLFVKLSFNKNVANIVAPSKVSLAVFLDFLL